MTGRGSQFNKFLYKAAVGPPDTKDLLLPPETRPWCEKGLAALKGKDPKPIYREPPKAEKGEKDKSVPLLIS